MTEFIHTEWHHARKPYKCSLCGKIIRDGELYLRSCSKINGELYDDCYHESCDAILKAFCDEQTPDEEYTFTQVEEWLRDCCQDKCQNWRGCECNVFRCDTIRTIILNNRKGVSNADQDN